MSLQNQYLTSQNSVLASKIKDKENSFRDLEGKIYAYKIQENRMKESNKYYESKVNQLSSQIESLQNYVSHSEINLNKKNESFCNIF